MRSGVGLSRGDDSGRGGGGVGVRHDGGDHLLGGLGRHVEGALLPAGHVGRADSELR